MSEAAVHTWPNVLEPPFLKSRNDNECGSSDNMDVFHVSRDLYRMVSMLLIQKHLSEKKIIRRCLHTASTAVPQRGTRIFFFFFFSNSGQQ
ncbi:hypothetical protein V5799_031352 [Amblyomma americanum]|uniref:Uncharacterized protein n=1 Tax=Amblyomma americanum TaxID=6943 RepID=A0AAQ4EKJ9_AMBAM